jgi:hypothetical protein
MIPHACLGTYRLHQPIGGGADHYSIGFGNALNPGGNVGRLSNNGRRVAVAAASHIAREHQAGVNADTNLKGQFTKNPGVTNNPPYLRKS